VHYFCHEAGQGSFYHRGTTGRFALWLVYYLKVARVHADALRLFAASSVEEQRQIYYGSVRDRLWNPAMKQALKADAVLSLLGVPKAQREHLERTCACSVADFMENCMEAVFTRLSTADNYFWRLYLFGRYSPECCPGYLQRENFERLKGGLVERIEVHTTDLTQFLQTHPGSLSHFVLLDHMDWLSHAYPGLLAQEWQAIVDRAREGARVLWRSGGAVVDFVDPIRVRFRGKVQRVGDLLRYDRDTALECQKRDRVHTYGSFSIADLPA
jgi:S-adenosylmethionine-diacylglycerol 3-amino-3-carboxypropyl transferase